MVVTVAGFKLAAGVMGVSDLVVGSSRVRGKTVLSAMLEIIAQETTLNTRAPLDPIPQEGGQVAVLVRRGATLEADGGGVLRAQVENT